MIAIDNRAIHLQTKITQSGADMEEWVKALVSRVNRVETVGGCTVSIIDFSDADSLYICAHGAEVGGHAHVATRPSVEQMEAEWKTADKADAEKCRQKRQEAAKRGQETRRRNTAHYQEAYADAWAKANNNPHFDNWFNAEQAAKNAAAYFRYTDKPKAEHFDHQAKQCHIAGMGAWREWKTRRV